MDRICTKSGHIVNLTSNQITQQFGRKLKQLDIPRFRFHDLSHYAASIMHAIGVIYALIFDQILKRRFASRKKQEEN